MKTHSNNLVVLAHVQLKPFYRLSTRDVTHVRKCTRPSPAFPYCKRRKAGWGLGTRLEEWTMRSLKSSHTSRCFNNCFSIHTNAQPWFRPKWASSGAFSHTACTWRAFVCNTSKCGKSLKTLWFTLLSTVSKSVVDSNSRVFHCSGHLPLTVPCYQATPASSIWQK